MECKKIKTFADLDSAQAFLGENSFFEGELRFTGSTRIGGSFKGRVEAKGTLIIESTAKVEATIEVDHLILLGELSGKVMARKSVIMEPPARFYGEVSTPSLSIKEGVFFEGSSKKI